MKAIKFTSIDLSQKWMTENLNVDRFKNGDLIPEAKTKKEWEMAGENNLPVWCYYENNSENGKKYGKLYNWFAVNDARGLAPEGWHIPTKAEFELLKTMVYNNGNSLKAVGQGTENGIGTNTSGFSALLAGYRLSGGGFYDLGLNTYFWSSTENGSDCAGSLHLPHDNSSIFTANHYYKVNGFSVRCIKD